MESISKVKEEQEITVTELKELIRSQKNEFVLNIAFEESHNGEQ